MTTPNHEDELAALRARRMNEIQEQLSQQAANQFEAEEKAQMEASHAANVDAFLRKHLTSDARARLARIAMVEPKRVNAIKNDLAAMLDQGNIESPMSDASLKKILAQLSKSRNTASVRRI